MRRLRYPSVLSRVLAAAALVAACGRSIPVRYASDGGADAGLDGGQDAGVVGCRPGVITLEKATPKVVFVLDRSGSMQDGFGGRGNSRWTSLTSALSNVLPPVDQTMELGALLFPAGNAESCSVSSSASLTPSLGNVGALIRLMRGTSPGGHTPTAQAIYSAATVVLSDRAATSARALVLATDGAPNCNPSLDPATCRCSDSNRCRQGILCLDDARTVAEITTVASLNIPTYVIGIQDNNLVAIETLNQMARAGGKPRVGAAQAYYAASSEAELEAALTTIRNQVGACVFLTSSVPDDDGSIVITVDGAPVPLDPANGWSWTHKDNGELAITGAACDAVVAQPDALVEAHVVCRPDAGVDGG